MDKKYEITEETFEYAGHILHRIRAVRSFKLVKAGDRGGWIEKEDNLSHEGNCWVADNAMICGNAMVHDNAKVYGDALVCGNAKVSGYAVVYGDAQVCGYAKVYDHAWVCGDAKVFGYAKVYSDAKVYGDAKVYDHANVCGDAKVRNNARVCGDAKVSGDANVYSDAWIANGTITKFGDYACLYNFWSSGRCITYNFTSDTWITGCFRGNTEELLKKAYKDDEKKGKCFEKLVNFIQEMKKLIKDE